MAYKHPLRDKSTFGTSVIHFYEILDSAEDHKDNLENKPTPRITEDGHTTGQTA